MAEVAWTRKYRPSSFQEYMGDNVKRMVINRFSHRDSIPNTIMLYGTRGTGKTSMARLLAKEILCMSPVDGHSCGQCEMCKAVEEYISSTEAGATCPGITEVDAATTNGKSDINDIIEDALIPPMYPLERKIIILDECHQLSVSAQNSLLKVIEEPPAYLVFILCTTDPEKVITTVKSRMQVKLEVKKKTLDEMVDKLEWVASKENLKISRQALELIAKKGDRVPRECINLLESIAKNFGNEVLIDTVKEALGEVSYDLYMEYYRAANSSLEQILQFNKTLKEQDISAKKFIQGLTRFTLDCLYVRHGIYLDEFPEEFVKRTKDLFKMYKASDFDVLLQVIEQAARGIDSDDTKSELIITNTAFRIGKIHLLAEGLASENEAAKEENHLSVQKYVEDREKSRKSAIDKLGSEEIKRETFVEGFKHISEVKDSKGMMEASESKNGVVSQPDGLDEKTRKIAELFNSFS